MKKILLLIAFLIVLLPPSYAQLKRNNTLQLKGSFYNHKDTTSLDYLTKYGNIANILVQIKDSYEYENLEIFKVSPLIKRLNIHSNSVKSLKGLEYLTELETLVISKSNISDFRILSKISSFKRLSLNSNSLIDFSFEFPDLEVLNYTCNYEIGNCHFPKLKYLTIHQAFIDLHRDDKNYGVNYQLEKPCCQIDLSNFDSLLSLQIYNMQIENINEIGLPENIKELRLSNLWQLDNLNGLKNLTQIDKLNIAFCNNVDNFDFLSELKNTDWCVRYMGKVYNSDELELLREHPREKYYYADGYENEIASDKTFYNFHSSVVEDSKAIFAKYHQMILSKKLSRVEFLNMIEPLIIELDKLCTEETCNIEWDDEESNILIYFLLDMAQIANLEFDESHLYKRFEIK